MTDRAIVLRHGLVTWIDEDDWPLVQGLILWCSDNGYVKCYKRGQSSGAPTQYLHRVLMGNPAPGLEVDHINRDRRDNRRANLRVVTTQMNVWNTGPSVRSTTGVVGVGFQHGYYYPIGRPWRAHITRDGRFTYLGNFATLYEAERARREAEIAYRSDCEMP